MNIIKVIIYSTHSKKEPFSEWETKLNTMTRAVINQRLDRVKIGNLGDAKIIKGGGGIWELRINHGPGYRIYFGKRTREIIVLLLGGDKGTQDRDIEKAKRYWLDYKERL
jgi:putative addiction module killer protein